ncbi:MULTISPECIES: hypothetical protein [unclassified Anabaena]|uniref:hypothetical protein n=1 Tax=unclassified Anabaena TaxID=2619674 RepID=UPI002B1F725C|nr:hypothetical protein [Anabaena sp. UHCC 0399]MEA5565449.1 hypothetical protein [Anabaena sp. UHCC 0399]
MLDILSRYTTSGVAGETQVVSLGFLFPSLRVRLLLHLGRPQDRTGLTITGLSQLPFRLRYR